MEGQKVPALGIFTSVFELLLDLSQLVRVSIGWQIGEVYHEQIGLCHDEKVFSTIWSNYTLQGGSIDFRCSINKELSRFCSGWFCLGRYK